MQPTLEQLEQRHVEVAHQQRYQLRKQVRLLKAHRLGVHLILSVVTCNACMLLTAPMMPNVLPKAETQEVAKNV